MNSCSATVFNYPITNLSNYQIWLTQVPNLREERLMPIEFTRTIPILRIFSVEKAKEFYVGWLGFQVD
jgi:hypothetical protein